MKSFLDCWIQTASALLPQALAGAPELVESLPAPLGEGAIGFAANLAGDMHGRFSVILDGALLESPLAGEGADLKPVWAQIVRETIDAAAAELLASTGLRCRVEAFAEAGPEGQLTRAFALRSGKRAWTILVVDELTMAQGEEPAQKREQDAFTNAATTIPADRGSTPTNSLRPGVELLLDVELEAALRFGSREMPLGDVLDLGPGDVVQLDRHVSDPVDLIVGDKIVARGEVVLVNGNFGLRVTEVAAPRRRLESIRCLF